MTVNMHMYIFSAIPENIYIYILFNLTSVITTWFLISSKVQKLILKKEFIYNFQKRKIVKDNCRTGPMCVCPCPYISHDNSRGINFSLLQKCYCYSMMTILFLHGSFQLIKSNTKKQEKKKITENVIPKKRKFNLVKSFNSLSPSLFFCFQ